MRRRPDARPVAQAAAVVRHWRAEGYSSETIASAAGLHSNTVHRVASGSVDGVSVGTERALLAVTRRMLERDRVMGDASRVREHVERLLAHPAVTPMAVARAAGTSVNVVLTILRGSARITRRVEECLLAVSMEQAVTAATVRPAGPTQLRSRQLQARGWSLRWQARALGSPYGSMNLHRTPPSGLIRAATEEALLEVYLEHRYQEGPGTASSRRAANDARRAGFYPAEAYLADGTVRPWLVRSPGEYPALAYDDDGTLHLEWLPGVSADEEGALRRAEVVRLCRLGLPTAVVADRLRLSPVAIAMIKRYAVAA